MDKRNIFGKAICGAVMALALGSWSFSASGENAHEDAVRQVGYVTPGSAVPDLPPGFTGVGPVVSGSVDFDAIPSKARKFLQKHCDGHAVVSCRKEFTSGAYGIELADGITMEFDAKGNLIDIQAPDNYSLSPALLKAVVPGKLFNLLDHNGFKSSVEAVHHDNKSYRLEVSDPVFNQICYDPSGVLTLIVDK